MGAGAGRAGGLTVDNGVASQHVSLREQWRHLFFARRACPVGRQIVIVRGNPPLAFANVIGYVGKRPNWTGG